MKLLPLFEGKEPLLKRLEPHIKKMFERRILQSWFTHKEVGFIDVYGSITEVFVKNNVICMNGYIKACGSDLMGNETDIEGNSELMADAKARLKSDFIFRIIKKEMEEYLSMEYEKDYKVLLIQNFVPWTTNLEGLE